MKNLIEIEVLQILACQQQNSITQDFFERRQGIDD